MADSGPPAAAAEPVPQRAAIAAVGTLVALSVQGTVKGVQSRNDLLTAAWGRHSERFGGKLPNDTSQSSVDFASLTAASKLPQLNLARVGDTEWLETVVPQLAVPPVCKPWRVLAAETSGATCAGDRFPQTHWNGNSVAFTDGMGTSQGTGRVLRAASDCMLRVLEKLPAALQSPPTTPPLVVTLATLASGKSVEEPSRLRALLSLSAVRQMAMVMRSAFAGSVSAAIADACAAKWARVSKVSSRATIGAGSSAGASGDIGDADATVIGDNSWGLWPDDTDDDSMAGVTWSASAEAVAAAGGRALDAVRYGFGWAALTNGDGQASGGGRGGSSSSRGMNSSSSAIASVSSITTANLGASSGGGIRSRRGRGNTGVGAGAGSAVGLFRGATAVPIVGLTPEVAVTRVRRVMRTAILSEGVAGPVEAARGKVSAEAAAGLAKAVEAMVGELTVRALGEAGADCDEISLTDIQSAMQRWSEMDFASAVVGPPGSRSGEWSGGQGLLVTQNHVSASLLTGASQELIPPSLPRAWGLELHSDQHHGISEVELRADMLQKALPAKPAIASASTPSASASAASSSSSAVVVTSSDVSAPQTAIAASSAADAEVVVKKEAVAATAPTSAKKEAVAATAPTSAKKEAVTIDTATPIQAQLLDQAKTAESLLTTVNWHDPPQADALALAGLIGEGAQLWSRPDMRVLAVELTEAEAEAAGRASALATLVVVGVLPAGAADCQYSVVSAARSAAMAAIREYQELEDDDHDAFDDDDDDDQDDSTAAAGSKSIRAIGMTMTDTIDGERVFNIPGASGFGPGVTLALAGVDAITASGTPLAGVVAKANATDSASATVASSSSASLSGGRSSRRGGTNRKPQAIGTPAERIAKRARLSATHDDGTSGSETGLGSGWNRLVREACGSISVGKDWNAKADRAARHAEALQRRIESKARAKIELKAELKAQTEHVWKPASVAAALSWDRPWHQRAAAVASMAQAAASAKGLAKPACYAAGSTAASALARRLQARGLHRAALEAQAVASAITIFGGLDKPLPQAMGLALPSLPLPQAHQADPVPGSSSQVSHARQSTAGMSSLPRAAVPASTVELPATSSAAASAAASSSSSSAAATTVAATQQHTHVPAAIVARASPKQSAPALVATLSPAEKARAMQQLLALPPEARARLSPLQQKQVLVLQHVQQINQLKALLQAGQLHRHPAAIKFLGSQETVDAVGRGEAEAVAQAGQKLTQLLNQAFTVMQTLQQQPPAAK